MKRYIGTKLIKAKPMNRLDYNNYRNWELPEDENGSDEGFLVEYLDGGSSNHKGHEGYISWSPKEVFENAYSQIDNLDFGEALRALKKGYKVARKGWNGKGMWLVLVPGTSNVLPSKDTTYQKAGINEPIEILSHIDMYTVDSSGRRAMLSGWLASQTDMLSDDWVIVD